MGIDIHGLNLLQHARNKKKLDDTITIGRQCLNVIEPSVKEIIKVKSEYKHSSYCEELLQEYFGANKVQSLDNSAFEGATHIANMNEPLPQNLVGKFDTVFDGGCLEHIYNVTQALKNYSLLCKAGGQIIHVLPANNFCGHGFYQFSPELFFSLYSQENGYDETEVFIADLSNTKQWYQVKKPENGERVNATSSNALYVLVRTVLRVNEFNHTNVQQSDYIHDWAKASDNKEEKTQNYIRIKQIQKNIPFVYTLLYRIYHLILRTRRKDRLNRKNPGLKLIRVKDLLVQ